MKRYDVHPMSAWPPTQFTETPAGKWCRATDVAELLDKMRLWAADLVDAQNQLHGIHGGDMAKRTIRDVERALDEASGERHRT